jgi:glycosyltransferase involved in cell wall biosynthesis
MRSFLPLKATSGAKHVMTLHYYTLTCAKKFMMYEDEPCSGPGLLKCLRCSTQHYGVAKGVPVTLGNRLAAAHERRAVDMFLAVSHATAAGNGLVGGKIPYEVIPNFVPDDASNTITEVELEPYLAQLPEDGYLLFVGDLRRVKGVDVLLRAYAGLSDVPPLVLIGKLWPESPASLPPNVTVLRDWPNPAVMEAWRKSSIALVPSLWPEPFGIVVIEAMKSGRPVIASNTGGIPDIVVDGETGTLVPPGDHEALAAEIRRLVDNPQLAARMGQAGRRHVREFQATSVVPRIEQVYQTLVPGRPRSASLALAR